MKTFKKGHLHDKYPPPPPPPKKKQKKKKKNNNNIMVFHASVNQLFKLSIKGNVSVTLFNTLTPHGIQHSTI